MTTKNKDEYISALDEIGITHEIAQSQSQSDIDYTEIDCETYGFEVRDSSIDGLGFFATREFSSNDKIAPARVWFERTQAGRYVNHSDSPNAEMVIDGTSIVLVAKCDIKIGDEVTINYRNAVDVNRLSWSKMAYDDKVDGIERLLMKFPIVEIPTVHKFIDGMYIREAFAKAGTILTSKIHKTEHPFVMTQGDQSILDTDGNWKRIKAPCWGITPKGSRRVVLIHSDTIMMSFHATDKTDLDSVEESIYEMRMNHLFLNKDDTDSILYLQRGNGSVILQGGVK